MKTAQSPLGAARAVSSPLLKRHTPVLLTPIPTANPFNLRIINDRNALIILDLPWQTPASFAVYVESRARWMKASYNWESKFLARLEANEAVEPIDCYVTVQLKNCTISYNFYSSNATLSTAEHVDVKNAAIYN